MHNEQLTQKLIDIGQSSANAGMAYHQAEAYKNWADENYSFIGPEDLAELVGGHAQANRDFEIEQAQKMMDYQTNANRIAMEFSAAEAQKNREWQEYMSNSSWQRSVEDLKKAGLNPILAYSQGGASTPSGATASGVTSSGTKASLTDKGYDFAKLLLDLYKSESSHSVSVLNQIISTIGSFASAGMKSSK